MLECDVVNSVRRAVRVRGPHFNAGWYAWVDLMQSSKQSASCLVPRVKSAVTHTDFIERAVNVCSGNYEVHKSPFVLQYAIRENTKVVVNPSIVPQECRGVHGEKR